ncbi:MAG: alkaline phosphatase family protein [Bradymonadia bacterium]
MKHRLLVINVVGLTPGLLKYTPRIADVAKSGFSAPMDAICPAVTCSAQATMLTGKMPVDHGIVGNGWYFRDLAEVLFWRQPNQFVTADKVWHTGRKRFGDAFTTAKMFWWYNMYAGVEHAATPRPVYPADGRKILGIRTDPAEFKDTLEERLGPFPFFNFWGPKAGIESSAWIAESTRLVIEQEQPQLALCYLPHLDYDLQRFGVNAPTTEKACRAIDRVAGELIDFAKGKGYQIMVVSEYGITDAGRPVHLNRILREAGYLKTRLFSTGWEIIDNGECEAMSVADHQIAHVYVKRPENIAKVKALLEKVDGVERVLDEAGKAELGLNHERAGELVVIAEPDAWFTYYYWFDEKRRPDYATSVDIHRKPGYDPVELFVDPEITAPVVKVAWTLLKKKLGFRYYMDVISTDASLVKGSHGRLPDRDEDGPVFLSSSKIGECDRMPMTGVHDLILDTIGGGPA